MCLRLSVSQFARKSGWSGDFHILDAGAGGNLSDPARCDRKHTDRTPPLYPIESSMRLIKNRLPMGDYEMRSMAQLIESRKKYVDPPQHQVYIHECHPKDRLHSAIARLSVNSSIE